MFNFFRRLFGGQDEVTQIFGEAKSSEDGTVLESEIPSTAHVVDLSESKFVPQVLNPLDWESLPLDKQDEMTDMKES